MNDLDILRPEVREALDGLSYFLTGTHNHDDFYTIRAELLRLASVGAELAALKARIAEAQECGVVALCGGGASLSHEPYPSLVGKRVRLLVEE